MIAPAKTKVSTPFGWVEGYPLNKGSYPNFGNAPSPNHGFHTGVDFSYYPDNKIYMPEDGTVQLYSWDGKDFNGNHIIITVENRRHFLGHIRNNGFLVKNGARVKMGTPIAIMGDTGYAKGAHLHWGLRIDGKIVNGLKYTKEYDEMPTRAEIKEYFNKYLRVDPTERQYLLYESRAWSEMAHNVTATIRNTLVSESAKVTAAAIKIKELEDQLAGEATELKPGKYVVK